MKKLLYYLILFIFFPTTLFAQWNSRVEFEDGDLRVSAQTYYLNIAKGIIKRAEAVNIIGVCNSTGAAHQVIWDSSGTYNPLAAAESLMVCSNNAADDKGGTGGRTVIFEGLDADYNVIRDTLDLDGTNRVKSAKEFLRLNRAWVDSSGADTLKGNLRITNLGADTTVGMINAYDGQTYHAFYTVPDNYTLYLAYFECSIAQAVIASFGIHIIPYNKTDRSIWVKKIQYTTSGNEFIFPIVISERTDVYLAVETTAASDVTASLIGWIERND